MSRRFGFRRKCYIDCRLAGFLPPSHQRLKTLDSTGWTPKKYHLTWIPYLAPSLELLSFLSFLSLQRYQPGSIKRWIQFGGPRGNPRGIYHGQYGRSSLVESSSLSRRFEHDTMEPKAENIDASSLNGGKSSSLEGEKHIHRHSITGDVFVHDHGADTELRRILSTRHLTMIALGSSIGMGLWLGSGTSLTSGGPAGIFLGYLLAGSMIWSVSHSIGEMAVMYPLPSAFVQWTGKHGTFQHTRSADEHHRTNQSHAWHPCVGQSRPLLALIFSVS